MEQIILFSGTTEGRTLAEHLDFAGIKTYVCVATEYGREVMHEGENITLCAKRLDENEMEALMREKQPLAVVDATHPFATVVSENIKKSAEAVGIPYLRLSRETEDAADGYGASVTYVKDSHACVEQLAGIEGNILLTTGSKELAVYCSKKELKDRLFVRVLPGEESLAICKEQGLTGKQIIAMQGPFSEELNRAILKQFEIRCLVTKESGKTGGYPEKLKAAAALSIPVIVLKNPEKETKQNGNTFEYVCQEIGKLTGTRTDMLQGMKTGVMPRKKLCESRMELTLAGIGMGNGGLLTAEVKEAIGQADCLIGAKRLLESLPEGSNPHAEKKNFYLPGDIYPYLREFAKKNAPKTSKAVILFSGDTGFYSGAKKMWELFPEWKESMYQEGVLASLQCCPGISSISYLSARCGISWQDAKIISLHGNREHIAWLPELLAREKKVFCLTSGREDLREIAKVLLSAGMEQVKITAGYQLSYPEEQIVTVTPEQCDRFIGEGLYTCILQNDAAEPPCLTPGLSDASFIRGKVPMTKEEVRGISLCKLGLHAGDVLYDIGSGTGSIAVEAARLDETIQVYAIERKEEALELIRENCKKFHLASVSIVPGEAPEACRDLPVPTHAFIGGSGGNLREILKLLYQKNKKMRVVANAITLETTGELTALFDEFQVTDEEIVQVSVSRAKKTGRYHLMQAENPVYICSFTFGGMEE